MTPSTRLLVLSQISYNRGTRLPMREICETGARARRAGVRRCGAERRADPDSTCGRWAATSWRCRGTSGCWGRTARRRCTCGADLIERLQPLAVVHGANRHYDFEGNFEPAPDTIHKFELTTHSGPVLAGLVGVDRDAARRSGWRRSRRDASNWPPGSSRACATSPACGITTPLDASVRSGIVTFEVDGIGPGATVGCDVAAGPHRRARVQRPARPRVLSRIQRRERRRSRGGGGAGDRVERRARRGRWTRTGIGRRCWTVRTDGGTAG